MNIKEEPPFFILGCVRSGTTLVRNLLRRQPNLICPEETHYYRWAEPFKSRRYTHTMFNNGTIIRHREIDGISDEVFKRIYESANSRADLLTGHITEFARAKGMTSYRWFEKTPQNVYGMGMIASDFPQSRFLHLVRNPLNVVASLKEGKIIKENDIVGACNFWNEAISIINQQKKALSKRILEVKYEDLTQDTAKTMAEIQSFFGIDEDAASYSNEDTHTERNRYKEILSESEQLTVRQLCSHAGKTHGYF
ncbi:MAG: Sulfotransferase domain [Rhodobacteraceae bacterium HLUCCO07]|nr:MAG: Sulfotransferase domain [Rhodobacteraceae bacterium HLUCCO07]